VGRDLLEKKFAALTREVIGATRGREIAAMIDRMEQLEDIGEFTRLLAK
jgi:hypothetical protein